MTKTLIFARRSIPAGGFFIYNQKTGDILENTQTENEIITACRGLSDDVQQELIRLIRDGAFEMYRITESGGSVEIETDNQLGMIKTLVLTEVAPRGERLCGSLWLCDAHICRDEARGLYRLFGDYEDESGDAHQFKIEFQAAHIRYDLFDCTAEPMFFRNPWENLSFICYSIAYKADTGAALLNDAERELLPLARELSALTVYGYDDKCDGRFPQMKALVAGHPAVVSLIERLERASGKRWGKAANKLIRRLCAADCEPLWREIFDKIKASQQGYPKQSESPSAEQLERIRPPIERTLHALGFEGSYPDFYKTAPIKGIHLAFSYEMCHTVLPNKQARQIIHCRSASDGEDIRTEFISGTIIGKNMPENADIYSCMFNDRGKRFYSATTWDCNDLSDTDAARTADDMAAAARVAAKRAAFQKLTRDERKKFSATVSGLGLFLSIFLICGGLFAVFMTLGLAVLACLITAVYGLAALIPEMLAEMPWAMLFGGTWIGFGGLCGLYMLLASRK